MKQTQFKVVFSLSCPKRGNAIYVYAFSVQQAMILAQAQRIQSGLDYEVKSTEPLFKEQT